MTHDVALIVSALADGAALCAGCLLNKTRIPRTEASSVIVRVREMAGIQTPDVPCTVCLTTRKVYRLTAATAVTGAPTQRPTTVAGRVLAFLHEHIREEFCARCLSTRLVDGRDIDVALRYVEGRGVVRHHGRCAECGLKRLVAGVMA
jgi:hypothetical protein